ncbi:MAG: DegV family protein [Anaerolineaceae bacterium]
MEIFADSCCDLTAEQINKYQIHVIPLGVFVNEKSYLDGVDISTPELFDLVAKTGKLPKTSAPSIESFVNAFKKSSEAIYISISSKLSASNQNGLIAAQSVPGDIRVIDSLNLSTGIGLLVLKAAELRDQGKSLSEIENLLINMTTKVNTSFVIDTLDYLYMGGRCTAMEHIVGSLLKIRPVIEVHHDGTLGVKEKVSGSRKKALDSMLVDFKKKLSDIDLTRVFITHATADGDAEYLHIELMKIAPINEICISKANATIASHCGPHCIGILFMTL